ncbi:outer membrane protein [Sphingomonas morindae]|uniref:Porin family protein n=1 Tax=Sphingomonas morindae TaxID=1541170 RepID=A0ABY4XB78_9SPHN|nr:porin family protein [Sphingomonas morindae]USI74214.1 porin family protein [Sphingomonas morindae]
MRLRTSTFILALPLALGAAPAFAQQAPFTGARVEGLIGWDRLQNNGHSDDIVYGVQGGYDVQMGPALVGIEGGIDDSNNKSCFGARTAADPRVCAKAARDLYIGARVGKVLTPRALIYAKAGYTNARVKETLNDGDTQATLFHTDLDGVRLGAGAEYAVGPNSYLKAEYRYSNYERGFSRNQLVAGFGFRF